MSPTPAPEQAHTEGRWFVDDRTGYTVQEGGWDKGVKQFRNRLSFHVQVYRGASNEEATDAAKHLVDSANACAGLNPSALPDALEAFDDLIGEADTICKASKVVQLTSEHCSALRLGLVFARAALASLKGAK